MKQGLNPVIIGIAVLALLIISVLAYRATRKQASAIPSTPAAMQNYSQRVQQERPQPGGSPAGPGRNSPGNYPGGPSGR